MKKAGAVFNLTLAATFMAIGLVRPFLTGQIQQFGYIMPVPFPTGIAMAFELVTYGTVIGLLYSISVGSVYLHYIAV